MKIQDAYDAWANTYDGVRNLTRDLEGFAIRAMVPDGRFANVLELGCGTGKNTAWLAARAGHLAAIDFSADMLARARGKLSLPNATFRHGDITSAWDIVTGTVDLVACSLVLEHVRDLDHVFGEASRVLQAGGLFYIGELHPFRQYQGSKARFEKADGATQEIDAFVHHLSDYTEGARRGGLACMRLREWFDDDDRTALPRIVSFLFRKNA